MEIIKVYSSRFDINDVNKLYNPIKNECMNILKENYEGKCFQGSFIKKIKSILKLSSVKISQNHSDGRGSVCIQFEAIIIQKEKNDIITDCTIIAKKDKRIFAKNEYSKIMISYHNIFKVIKEYDMIPIKINGSKYTPFQDKISIYASPYLPEIKNVISIYVVDSKLNNKEISKLQSYIDQINILKKKIKNFNNNERKKFNKFADIYYPYKNKKIPHLLKINKFDIELLDITSIKLNSSISYIFIQSDEIEKSKPFILYTKLEKIKDIQKYIQSIEEKSEKKYTIINDSAFIVLEIIYISYIKYTIFLIEMTEIYDYPKDTLFWNSIKEYKG